MDSSKQTMSVQFAGTMQLAALGPTSVIFSFSSYVFNALGIATTSKVSELLGRNKPVEASQCAGAALVAALVAGIVSFFLLEVRLLPLCCGSLPSQALLASGFLGHRYKPLLQHLHAYRTHLQEFAATHAAVVDHTQVFTQVYT